MRTANSRLPTAQQPQQNEQGQQQQQKGPEDKKKQGKRQRKKISLAIKPQNFETSKGLKQLYQLTKQIRWDDPMTTDSAMNLVVMTLKSWHYQFKPKYSTDYFLKRCQVVGSDKQVLSYLHKVRRIHKGLDQWQQSKPDNPNPNKSTSSNKPNEEGVILQQQGLPYENYDDSPGQQILPNKKNPFSQRAEIAKKLAHTTQKNNVNQSEQQNEMDQMMDEDLRMFQEMNRNRYQAGNKEKGNKNEHEHQDDDDDEGMELGGESELDGGYQEYYDD